MLCAIWLRSRHAYVSVSVLAPCAECCGTLLCLLANTGLRRATPAVGYGASESGRAYACMFCKRWQLANQVYRRVETRNSIGGVGGTVFRVG